MGMGSPGKSAESLSTADPAAVETLYAEPQAARSLLDLAVEAAGSAPTPPQPGTLAGPPAGFLETFLDEPSIGKSLQLWFGVDAPADRDTIAHQLARDIARIDALITEQLNVVLHHEAFQHLEASWRGLKYLVEQAGETENVKVRILNVSWQELARDAERAIEFDQSQLFRKVYSDEFGMPGGEPFGILLGDYQVRLGPSADHPVNDLEVLEKISQAAAAAFAPFVAAAHPSLLGLESFAELEQPLNLHRVVEQLEYLKWKQFRATEDARFVGLTLPRMLVRLPYDDDGTRVDGFLFREEVAGPSRNKYLWGNAAYAFGAAVIRAFGSSGWLADIRGVQRGVEGGGIVTGLPVHCFSTEKRGVAPKCSTEVIVTDRQEPDLSDLGFIPLCPCKDTEYSAFYANQSVQKPKKYDDPAAVSNARISSMLQYMLCASRFAHYLKVIARDKIGALTEAEEVEDYLHRWLHNYVADDPSAGPETKAKYPLRKAEVRVREQPGKPGSYLCVAHLWPHYQLDELVGSLRLATELMPARPS